jgi:hypothetical protein
MLGVVNDVVPVPPANTAPPVAAAYQSIVSPAPTLADMTTVPVPHLEPLTGLVGAAGTVFTVAVTATLVAEVHPVVVFLTSA